MQPRYEMVQLITNPCCLPAASHFDIRGVISKRKIPGKQILIIFQEILTLKTLITQIQFANSVFI